MTKNFDIIIISNRTDAVALLSRPAEPCATHSHVGVTRREVNIMTDGRLKAWHRPTTLRWAARVCASAHCVWER